jgi:hypothetical protein
MYNPKSKLITFCITENGNISKARVKERFTTYSAEMFKNQGGGKCPHLCLPPEITSQLQPLVHSGLP